jgi:hypothetical protein
MSRAGSARLVLTRHGPFWASTDRSDSTPHRAVPARTVLNWHGLSWTGTGRAAVPAPGGGESM